MCMACAWHVYGMCRSAKLGGVVCGSRQTLALDTEGKVFAWGKGEDGALGIGDRSTAMTPRLVETLLRQPIAQMTCRGAHVLALTERGQVSTRQHPFPTILAATPSNTPCSR